MWRLNLGCGIYYYPNYVNIDISPNSVADLISDVLHLPFKSNCITKIEASHILEHFDVGIVPFILSEWFRVLKPRGTINIETPDLKQSIKRLDSKSNSRQKDTLRFLFGEDSPGNSHKLGFTSSILLNILQLIGFQDIKRQSARSFKNEAGLRVTAKKPDQITFFDKKNFLTEFRSKILTTFHKHNSLFFNAVEQDCIYPLYSILPNNLQQLSIQTKIPRIISSLTLFHPRIAKAFLSMYPVKCKQNIDVKVLEQLENCNLQSFLLENWKNWSKVTMGNNNSLTVIYRPVKSGHQKMNKLVDP